MLEEFRTPQSANEALLQNILGAENEIREPQSVTEYYLKKIWEEGSGGGGDSYMHNILIRVGQNYITCLIITKDNNAFSFSTLHNWLKNNGLDNPNKLLSASGKLYISNNENIVTSVVGIRASGSYIYIDALYYDNGYYTSSKNLSDTSDVHITDTVIKI